jgi:hypothetical protein
MHAPVDKDVTIKDVTDEFGYFELINLNTEPEEIVKVTAGALNMGLNLQTNLLSGSKNVELKLEMPYQITGTVFLENLYTPATNFSVYHSKLERQRYFSHDDGSFTFDINLLSIDKFRSDSVIISATGFSPVCKKYNFRKNSVCDLGKIILKPGKTANIKGRIVNPNGEKLSKSSIQVNLFYKDNDFTKEIKSDYKTGNYLFENVLPGKAELFAKYGELEAKVEVDALTGKTVEAPDLVIGSKDKVAVRLFFKLPDGDVPANASVRGSGYTYATWGRGDVPCILKPRTYQRWKIEHKGKKFIADDFEVTEFSDEIEVQLRELTK